MNETNDWVRGVVALLLAAGIALAGSGVAAGAEEKASAAFEDDSLTVTRGGILEVTVSHSDTAHVYLGGERSGYLLEVTLAGSGTDTITLDTYRSASNDYDTYLKVNGGNGNVTQHSDDLSEPLVATKYLMNVTVGGVERDLGHFVVAKRDTAPATANVAPGELDLSDAETDVDAVRDAATARDTVAWGDYAVTRVDMAGLSSAFNGSDLTGGANAEGIEVRFTRTDTGPNVKKSFLATPDNGTTVFSTFADDSVADEAEQKELLLVWDTTAVPAAEDPRNYEVTMTLNEKYNGLVDEDTVVASTDFTLVPPSFSLSADPGFTLPPWNESSLAVAGETNLAPGTTLDVRARSEAPSPFLKPKEATVDANGTFATEFDFADVPRGTSFPLWVLGYRGLTEHTVALQAEEANVTFRDQTTRGTGVTVESVTLSAGGFVVIQDETVGIRGASSYLTPGTHRDVRVSLVPTLGTNETMYAVPYGDRNGNGTFESRVDHAYAPNGTPVLATANVTLTDTARTPTPEPTTTAAPTTAVATPTPEPTTTALPVREESPLTPSDGESDDDGFLPFPLPGPLSALGDGRAVSIVAVVGAGVLALRRRF